MKLLRKFCAEQVIILLDRMESHPEEFFGGFTRSISIYDSRWDLVLSAGEFTRIEKYLIRKGVKKIKRERTLNQIITTLTDTPVEIEGMNVVGGGIALSTTSRFNYPEQNVVKVSSVESPTQW